ncbi:SDR family oxidoreductase, partial [Campylobacter coli]|nr:SDR family oxidoreductase [Campylobacter coli]EKO3152087.1 SDR family oxidoreductase [Campylobacter coli]EKP4914697.1 SDR family oxidoreductase [Campylobacter coli]EKP4973532.1 SDR family oxidoreductase [Campylobacter coli]ELL6919836.1 SDR family oxidoreductase [Campylobacter coli]
KNIRVNVVSGGPIETDALRAFTNYEEVKQATINLSPLNRMGQPEDLAGACLFLCSNKASWVTGMYIAGLIESLEFRLPLCSPSKENFAKIEEVMKKYKIKGF